MSDAPRRPMPRNARLPLGYLLWLAWGCGGQQPPPVDTSRSLPSPEPQADLTRAEKPAEAPPADKKSDGQ